MPTPVSADTSTSTPNQRLARSRAEPRGDQRKQRQRQVSDALKNAQRTRVQPHYMLQQQSDTDQPERNEGECGVGDAGAEEIMFQGVQ